MPQTREQLESGQGCFEMFRTWPGDWKATIRQLVCDSDKVACVIDFDVGEARMTGISVFGIQGGAIAKVTDCWPALYEPPA